MRPPIDEPIAENAGWRESDMRLRETSPSNPNCVQVTHGAEEQRQNAYRLRRHIETTTTAGADVQAGPRLEVNRGQE
jgi:hypothetical protein